jgi:homoserine kinase
MEADMSTREPLAAPVSNSWESIRVPASSANLGPGFDALGMAVQLYLGCRFRRADALRIAVRGKDAASIPTTADNMIWQTALTAAAELGGTLPPIELEIENDIPIGKGLGSSAAALIAGVVIAVRLMGLPWDRHQILDMAARIEGHPDNVAAAVLGGIVCSAIDDAGIARAIRLHLPETIGASIVVPDFEVPTSKAREVLPSHYSKEDAIFNIQRAALLIAALATGRRDVFPTALMDKLHQSYRAKLIPGLEEILALRADGLLGCAISGAGPSILVIHESNHAEVCELVQAVFRTHSHETTVFHAGIDEDGLVL